MTGAEPGQIWAQSDDEGKRRLDRSAAGLAATGVMGGTDVMLGIVALTVASGALALVMPEPVAHMLGSLTFGIGFVLIAVGRSELFTENFLVPVATVLRGSRGGSRLLRLWSITFVANLAAIAALALILTRAGLVPPQTLDAAAGLAETFAARDWLAALLSAIVAGTVMTLMTWLLHATQEDISRIVIALVIGFLLAAPSLNHAVVSFGEMIFGLLADRGDAQWLDLVQNLPLAIIGNLIGGLFFVTAARAVQVRGEPDDEEPTTDASASS